MVKLQQNKIIIIGIIITIFGIIIGLYPILKQQKDKITEEENIKEFINETSNTSYKEIDISNENSIKDEYIMVLEIPKINLRKGIYEKTSKLNTIEKNITILKESTMPNEENSNLILAGHSGRGDIAYFDKLSYLKNKDKAYIYYNGTKYTYKVDNIYDVIKDGNVEVIREKNKKTLTLITCKENTLDKQIIIILYMEEESILKEE